MTATAVVLVSILTLVAGTFGLRRARTTGERRSITRAGELSIIAAVRDKVHPTYRALAGYLRDNYVPRSDIKLLVLETAPKQ